MTQVLNGLKTAMHQYNEAGTHIRETISERKAELAKFDGSMANVADEKTIAERTTRRLKVGFRLFYNVQRTD